MDKDSLLNNSNKRSFKGDLAFIIGFHWQYKEVESIFRKNWPILLKDKDLKQILPKKPKFIYRKAPGLRNKIAPNISDPPKKPSTFLDREGFYYCTRCRACKTTKSIRKMAGFYSMVTKHEHKLRSLITCDSEYVIYVLECPSPFQYVGRIMRKLRTRINKHIANIKSEFVKHSVSRHFKQFHNRDSKLLTFYGIDKISRHWRGTHLKRGQFPDQ